MRGTGTWSAAVAGLLIAVLAASCNEGSGGSGAGSDPTPDTSQNRAEGSAMPPSSGSGFVVVGQGNQAWNPRESDFGPQIVVFRSRAAWERLGGHYQFGTMAPDWEGLIQRVNFDRQSLVALTLGEAGSTGYTITLERVEPGSPMRFVLRSTRPDGVAGAMMTHPFQLVILETTDVPANAEFLLDGRKTDFERHVME